VKGAAQRPVPEPLYLLVRPDLLIPVVVSEDGVASFDAAVTPGHGDHAPKCQQPAGCNAAASSHPPNE
jgi:hypothetical protein